MLFSSHIFLTGFLPIAIVLYFVLARFSNLLGVLTLVVLSAVFYAWRQPIFLLLIFSSICINYFFGLYISKHRSKKTLILGIVFNLLLILAFKYLDFVISNINFLFSTNIASKNLPLPLAISFFTFQQIGFLVGIFRHNETCPSFLHYSSFVTFFPQLIAGPIVRHSDYLPQLTNDSIRMPSMRNLSIGSTLFIIGLFKKVFLADQLAIVADTAFGTVQAGITLNPLESWFGVLAYSLQIYFDFSGYSDMALGLARMFNIHLPINFNSPYKASSIIDFWRRWHISLSTFLKEHIYIPLGGNKVRVHRCYLNIMITMLIGGLWHGASWTFVIWGGIHGALLTINHLIRKFTTRRFIDRYSSTFVVFILVSFAWVFFRANNLVEIRLIFKSLFNITELFSKNPSAGSHITADTKYSAVIFISLGMLIALCMPNIYEWMSYFKPAKDFKTPAICKTRLFKFIAWRPTFVFSLIVFTLLSISFIGINKLNEFIYFKF